MKVGRNMASVMTLSIHSSGVPTVSVLFFFTQTHRLIIAPFIKNLVILICCQQLVFFPIQWTSLQIDQRRKGIFIEKEWMIDSVLSPLISCVMTRPLGHFYKSDNYKFRGKLNRLIKKSNMNPR